MRKLAVNALLVLVTLVVSVLAADALFRWYEARTLAAPDPQRTDPVDLLALNYNDTQVPHEKPEGEFRVLSFGDSFGYSIMSPSYSYSGIMASTMSEALGDEPRVRVVNLGEPASTVTDYAAGYGFWSGILEHDAAVFNIYMGNDILDVAYHFTPTEWSPNRTFRDLPYRVADGKVRDRVPHKFPLRMMDYGYALYLNKYRMDTTIPAATKLDPRFNVTATHGPKGEDYLKINRTQLVNFDFSRIETIKTGYEAIYAFFDYLSGLQRQGRKILVTLGPNEVQVEPGLRQQLVETFGEDMSRYDFTLPARVIMAIRDAVDPELRVVDMSPYFDCEARAGEDLYYLTNTHWGPEGNALAGRIMADQGLRAWLGKAGVELPVCDTQAYWPDHAKVPDEAIQRFVADLQAASVIARFSEDKVAVDRGCGSLDGVRFTDGNDAFLWGWACDAISGEAIKQVILLDNGQLLKISINAGLERPDVVEALGKEGWRYAGWNAVIPKAQLKPGMHRIQAYAVMDDGHYAPLRRGAGVELMVK